MWYMTSDERQDWIKHLLSEVDVAAAQTPTPDLQEPAESLLKEVGEVEVDFMSHSR